MSTDLSRIAACHAIMRRQLDLLTGLVEELLDASRLSLDKLELHRTSIDCAALIETAVETTRPMIEERHHQLTIQVPHASCSIVGDRVQLARALTNLLANAARYTPEGGHISIELSVDAPRECAVFRVRDDGIGISQDLLSSIFELCVRAPDAKRMGDGLGIGLHVVREIVALHKGSVSARSAGAGKGSEFTIELPL
jgi:signal transduction histidine kinase